MGSTTQYTDFDEDFAADAKGAQPYRSSYLLNALSESIYDGGPTRKKRWKTLGLKEVDFKSSTQHGAEGAVVIGKRYIFLVLRGTQGVKDMVQDVRITRGHKWSKDKIPVHDGFGDQAKSLYGWARVTIAKHKGGRKLWVTGHSLGGALANLLAYRLVRDDGFEVDGVMTFAAPRVGGQSWQKKYQALLGDRSWRWINRQDPIPHAPLGKAWRAVGTRHVIRKRNKLRFNGAKSPKADWTDYKRHKSPEYLRSIWSGMPSEERGAMPEPKVIDPNR